MPGLADLASGLVASAALLTLVLVVFDPTGQNAAPPYFTLMAGVAWGLSKVLKRALRHPRPVGSTESDHGMPSSHAVTMSYLAASFIFAVVLLACVDNEEEPGAAPVAAPIQSTVRTFTGKDADGNEGTYTMMTVYNGANSVTTTTHFQSPLSSFSHSSTSVYPHSVTPYENHTPVTRHRFLGDAVWRSFKSICRENVTGMVIGTLGLTALLLGARVASGQHTAAQILVGCGLGVAVFLLAVAMNYAGHATAASASHIHSTSSSSSFSAATPSPPVTRASAFTTATTSQPSGVTSTTPLESVMCGLVHHLCNSRNAVMLGGRVSSALSSTSRKLLVVAAQIFTLAFLAKIVRDEVQPLRRGVPQPPRHTKAQ